MKKNIFVLGLSSLLALTLFSGMTVEVGAVNNLGENGDKTIEEEREEYINNIFESTEVAENITEGNKKIVEADSKLLTRAGTGTYSSRAGVILYTPDKLWGLPIGHAAMIMDKNYVYEALPDYGVRRGSNNWYSSKSQAYCLGVKGTTVAQDKNAANYCKNQSGKPYNWALSDITRRDQFYCSHLIYAAYIDVCGVDLNTPIFDGTNVSKTIHPSELLSGPKTTLLYRKK